MGTKLGFATVGDVLGVSDCCDDEGWDDNDAVGIPETALGTSDGWSLFDVVVGTNVGTSDSSIVLTGVGTELGVSEASLDIVVVATVGKLLGISELNCDSDGSSVNVVGNSVIKVGVLLGASDSPFFTEMVGLAVPILGISDGTSDSTSAIVGSIDGTLDGIELGAADGDLVPLPNTSGRRVLLGRVVGLCVDRGLLVGRIGRFVGFFRIGLFVRLLVGVRAINVGLAVAGFLVVGFLVGFGSTTGAVGGFRNSSGHKKIRLLISSAFNRSDPR